MVRSINDESPLIEMPGPSVSFESYSRLAVLDRGLNEDSPLKNAVVDMYKER